MEMTAILDFEWLLFWEEDIFVIINASNVMKGRREGEREMNNQETTKLVLDQWRNALFYRVISTIQ